MAWVNWFLHWPYHREVLATFALLLAAWLIAWIGKKTIIAATKESRGQYRARQALNTLLLVAVIVALVIMWALPLKRTGTFLGLIGAGLAIALREPLLSVAGRIAIFAGQIYTVGDRIEINKMSGDVIDIGFFYTRMMEIGNWIGGDQYSGRIIQFANASIFGTALENYTRSFAYIWDEVHLPVTYDSNVQAATDILREVGEQYSKEFLEGAEEQLHRMKRYFVVPDFELEPQVYTKVTSNYVELTMRYVVDPKKRRSASTFIYRGVFDRVQKRKDISIGSDTMTVTVQAAKGQQLKAAMIPADKQQPAAGDGQTGSDNSDEQRTAREAKQEDSPEVQADSAKPIGEREKALRKQGQEDQAA